MPDDDKPTPKYKVGDEVQALDGPKMVVDAVYIPPGKSSLDNLIAMGNDGDDDVTPPDREPKYWCIWWIGHKRQREQFTEGTLKAWVAPTK